MMKNIVVLTLLLALAACKKNKLGGDASISGKVVHHAKPIPFARVFIKFNEKDFPGTDTTKYDDHVTADSEGNFSIKCYRGDYYLFGYGSDNAITPPKVVGGIPVKVHRKENVKTDVPVTED
jgi:hypothetical protein